MNWLTKAGLTLAVIAGSFASGYFTRKPGTVTKTEVVEKEKTVTKTVVKVVEKPDGTTSTETTTETATDSTTVTDKKSPNQPMANSTTTKPKYSVQVNWTPRLDVDAYKPTGMEFGRRIYDTNAWGTVGYDWRDKSVSLGIRIDF